MDLQQILAALGASTSLSGQNTQNIDALVKALQDGGIGGGGTNLQRPSITSPSGLSISTPRGGIPNPITIKNTEAALQKLTGALGMVKGVGGAALNVLDELGTYGKDKYDPLQRAFGGLADGLNSTNETSREVVQSIDKIYSVYFSNEENMDAFMVERNNKRVNALYTFFKNEQEVANNFLRVRENLASRQTVMINQMTAEEQAMLGTFSKGLRLSNREVAELLERQISKTGEASNEIFLNISKFAKATADATGISFQEITADIAEIITDVETFGNVSEEQAARIAGNLGQIGLSVRGFGQMVDRFMNFDTAAESLGNLSTVFGVHFDAMEMMMLSSTDPEEFLHRMRESFLDAGMDMEEMTLPEKRLAAQQLSMSVTEFENFMQEGRAMTDLQRETSDAKRLDGFQTMVDQMAIEGKSLEDMTEHLQRKVFDELSEGAYKVGNQFEVMKGKLVMNPEQFLPGYQQYFHSVRESMEAMTGTGERAVEYTQLYQDMVDKVADFENLSHRQIEHIKELQARADDLSAIDMIELSLSVPTAADYVMTNTAKIQALGAAVGSTAGDEISKAMEPGITIDEARVSALLEEKLRAVAGSIESGGAGGLGAQSPSPAIGIPLMYGIIAGVTDLLSHPGNQALIDEGLASFGSYVSKGISVSVAGSENPLIASLSEGDANVTISSEGVISDIVEQLKVSQDKSDEVITKMKSEEAENLRVVSEALQESSTAVKAMSEKETIVQTVVKLNERTLFDALRNYKSDDGTFIKFVVPR